MTQEKNKHVGKIVTKTMPDSLYETNMRVSRASKTGIVIGLMAIGLAAGIWGWRENQRLETKLKAFRDEVAFEYRKITRSCEIKPDTPPDSEGCRKALEKLREMFDNYLAQIKR